MSRGICVLGSTGSIGTQTLDILARETEKFHVVSLSAGKNLELLKEQIAVFRPRRVSVLKASSAKELEGQFPGIEFYHGPEGLLACTGASGVDIVVVGIVGFAALAPTVDAIRAGKKIALANKEALVVAGPLISQEIQRAGATVIPVDSEHNALFQLLEKVPREQVSSVVLTASGGPLLRRPELPLEEVTPEIAVKHPNWSMGPKISVDSATLMNKGLEVIEAFHLFHFPSSKIEVWVHPQSIVHGALWLTDNSCFAQLSKPDMRSSIGHALEYPNRLSNVIDQLSFSDMAKLEFFEPDMKRFPCLGLAREALEASAAHLVALNAANEIAVGAFLERRISFPGIPKVIGKVLERFPSESLNDLAHVFHLDQEARRRASEEVGLYRPTNLL